VGELKLIRQDDSGKMQEALAASPPNSARATRSDQGRAVRGDHWATAAPRSEGINDTLKRLGPEYKAKGD